MIKTIDNLWETEPVFFKGVDQPCSWGCPHLRAFGQHKLNLIYLKTKGEEERKKRVTRTQTFV